jgi:hypothetical protein
MSPPSAIRTPASIFPLIHDLMKTPIEIVRPTFGRAEDSQ